eukprot:NODE_755_length_1375_cov_4.098485.p7 GENE.NODE_755_length_1375_cov_4.098485~~NODE_755_length_1375_cov_4.098485.p7  ORF type:complete len:50 (-),score=9.50 NODE_755_length_1375_cov_4.098485:109-258(-)
MTAHFAMGSGEGAGTAAAAGTTTPLLLEAPTDKSRSLVGRPIGFFVLSL